MSIINVTRSAAKQLVRVAKEHNVSRILFSVKSGGCVGLQYQLDPMEENPKKFDEIINISKKSKVELVVCGQSLMHVFGTSIGWKKDIMGESFHFDNPTSNNNCGCGTSFN